MPKNSKKKTIDDLKEEITQDAAATAEKTVEKAGEIAQEVTTVVENITQEVKKDKRFKSIIKKIRFGRFGLAALLLIAIAGVGTSGYFYYQYQNTQKVLGESQNQYAEVKDLVDEVAHLMDLPKEEPTVATVSDIEKLKSQPFFNRAQNGDKVLIYQSTRKAILYRPATKKIIDVATVNLGEPSPAASKSEGTESLTPTPAKSAKVVILNGTTTTGLTRRAESELSEVKNIEIVDRANAKKNDYSKNIVADISGSNEEKVKELASKFNAQVASLPDGEDKPQEGDIIIILGSDYVGSEE